MLTRPIIVGIMTTVPVECLRADLAKDMLRDCLGAGGSVVPGKHFLEELANESLALPDAWLVMRSGCIYKAPELNIKSGDWKYTIEGYTADGIWIAIVFCFKQINRAYLITVFSIEAKKRNS
jgi:hypothetical protein